MSVHRKYMISISQCICVVVFCAVLMGCSSYRVAYVDNLDNVDEAEMEGILLTEGHSARITMLSGKKKTGYVLRITDDAICLDKPRNEFSDKGIVIPMNDIHKIEVKQSGPGYDHARKGFVLVSLPLIRPADEGTSQSARSRHFRTGLVELRLRDAI